MAEEASGEAGLETLEGTAATVDEVVAAVCSMSLSIGRRFVIVDGVEKWKAEDTEPLEKLLADMPPDTTLAMFAREDGRQKVPKCLIDAVKAGKGKVQEEKSIPPWELPQWARTRASELGLNLDAAAAKTLVGIVGERQQRLSREIEKLALSLDEGEHVDADMVLELCANSAERNVWTLSDALISGQTRKAVYSWLELEHQGESAGSVVGTGAWRLRAAVDAAERLQAGESPSAIKRTLRMPPKKADQLLRNLQSVEPEELRDALASLARLELVTRGGGQQMTGATAVARAIAEMAD
jgi:DNA polymerase-3 subunit delta